MPRPRLRVELLPLLLAILLGGAAAYAFAKLEIPSDWKPWLRVTARSHPLLVHFPIALLAVAVVFDLLFRRKEGECGDAAYWTLLFGLLGGVVASIAGWLHGALEPHSASVRDLLDQHRWLEVGATAAALLAALGGYAFRTSEGRGGLWLWRLGLYIGVALVSIGGHLGGTLVYGEGFLFEPLEKKAPSAPAVTAPQPTPILTAPPADLGPPVDFVKDIKPIFDAKCVECHGETKKKGQLRLDRWSERIAGITGGKLEPVIVPGKPDESDCVRRIESPMDDDDRMPPESDALPKNEIELIRRWILQGAPWPRDTTDKPTGGG